MLPIMLTLFLMLLYTYYANNYADIMDAALVSVIIYACVCTQLEITMSNVDQYICIVYSVYF